MAKQNTDKNPPKGSIRFSLTLSEEQKAAKQAILHHPYNFIVGKAGSGKTLLACQVALDMFFKRRIDKIIITRPTVSTEDNGFLPGSEKEKMEPWLVPIRSNMRKVYNKPAILEKMESNEQIELVSLAHFRGRTFDNAVVIVDEYQNLKVEKTPEEQNPSSRCRGAISIEFSCEDCEKISTFTILQHKGSTYLGFK